MAEFDRGYDPVATMTLLYAALTIQDDTERVNIQLLNELQAGLDQLAVSNIQEIMKIDQFLNPIEEQVTDDLEDLDAPVIAPGIAKVQKANK
ncbi:hypothetical protein BDW69DRAFT_186573 [Aspergillus filifer]